MGALEDYTLYTYCCRSLAEAAWYLLFGVPEPLLWSRSALHLLVLYLPNAPVHSATTHALERGRGALNLRFLRSSFRNRYVILVTASQ